MIVISAGHYPEKPGACCDGFCEHSEASRWAIDIADYLVMKGVSCVLAPTGVLRTKVDYINELNADIAVEVHFNSAKKDGKHVGQGCETLYYPNSEKGALLAHNVQEAMSETFTPDRGIKEGYYRMNKANGPDFFLAKTNCTSIIIEPEFIQYQSKIQINRLNTCHAIAEALIKTRDEFNG